MIPMMYSKHYLMTMSCRFPGTVLLVLVLGVVCGRGVWRGVVHSLVRRFMNIRVNDLGRRTLGELVASDLHGNGRSSSRGRRAAVEALVRLVETVGDRRRRAGGLRRLKFLLRRSIVHLARVVRGDVLVEGNALLGDGSVVGVELGRHLERNVGAAAADFFAVEAGSTMAADDHAVDDEGDEEEEATIS